ncbi:MAG: ParB/RepB/Spo0J family partition protein [Pseudomonadota bacterium]
MDDNQGQNKKRRLGKGLSELLGEARVGTPKIAAKRGSDIAGQSPVAAQYSPASDATQNIANMAVSQEGSAAIDMSPAENEAEMMKQEIENLPSGPDQSFAHKATHLKQQIEKKLSFICPIELIEPNSDQPRKAFDADILRGLADSIEEFGILQPLIVVKKEDEEGYMIVAGERRWRASQMAGLKEVPVILKDYDMINVAQVALIENIQRQDLSPIEEAKAYASLVSDYDMTQNEIAVRVGKSRSYIANMLRMLRLGDGLKDLLERGEISVGHAKVLAGVEPELADKLAKDIVKRGLNVRELERKIAGQEDLEQSSKQAKAKPSKDADTLALEADLAAALGTKAEINMQRKGAGEVVVSFSSFEELDEICRRLSHPGGIHE